MLEGGECKVGIEVFVVGQKEFNCGDEFIGSVIRLEGDGPFNEGFVTHVYMNLLGHAECSGGVSGVRFEGGAGVLALLLQWGVFPHKVDRFHGCLGSSVGRVLPEEMVRTNAMGLEVLCVIFLCSVFVVSSSVCLGDVRVAG